MFTHINKDGRSKMVDVGDKVISKRSAKAMGKIFMDPKTIILLKDNNIPKGNVLNTAQVAGIMAIKKTSDLIPMCHTINVDSCDIDFEMYDNYIKVVCVASINAKTGIEMEVLMGVNVTLLTIYDMCKAVDKSMIISDITLLEKHGGKSGSYVREDYNG
ncbi:MAG: cyclic pyranopterin monophosphate synthase MoaC [Bacilli bacterium]